MENISLESGIIFILIAGLVIFMANRKANTLEKFDAIHDEIKELKDEIEELKKNK